MNKIKEIAQVLAVTEDEKVIEKFLVSLLTKNEVNEISSRWELVKLLDVGMSQRKIAGQLKLSLCKITRGSRELKKKSSAFKYMIDVYKKLFYKSNK
jgi:TrpR family transcriptional regulator, trp operon repressor